MYLNTLEQIFMIKYQGPLAIPTNQGQSLLSLWHITTIRRIIARLLEYNTYKSIAHNNKSLRRFLNYFPGKSHCRVAGFCHPKHLVYYYNVKYIIIGANKLCWLAAICILRLYNFLSVNTSMSVGQIKDFNYVYIYFTTNQTF